MDINNHLDGSILTAAVAGRIDTVTAPQLEAALKADMSQADSLVLDFAGVEYISSAGLRVLLSTHKVMMKKGGMVIRNINETVSEIFEVTGFTEILTIE